MAVQLQESGDSSTFNACDPRWLETSGKLSCEAASRKLRRFVSGRAATFLLLGVLTGAGGMAAKAQLGRATGPAQQVCAQGSSAAYVDSYAKRLLQA